MASRSSKPLFAPGNEAEWARINEEEERQEAEFSRLIVDGGACRLRTEALAAKAVSLLVASVKPAMLAKRALWS